LTLLIYLLSFCSVSLFAYMAIHVFKEFQQVPIMEDNLVEDSRFRKNPVFRLMMTTTRLFTRFNLNLNLGAYEGMLKKKLDAAGAPWDLKPAEYLALKELCAIVIGILGIMLHVAVAGQRFPILNSVVMIGLGYFVPNFFVNRIIRERHMSILRDLPFTCDLLTLAVDAGLDFGTALEKVVTSGPPGPLRNEMFIVLQEMKIGKTRREALNDLATRVQLQEVTNFTGAVVQADRMGSGFSNVLRIQSKQVRTQRFERAEKMAQKLPVKILLPIIIVNLLSIGIILVIPLLSTIKKVI
jgi:tight adherence protein C